AYENERNSQLESITRITQMYDLEKVFNSNLEMDDLMKMIASKFHEVMNVQGVNLWMVEGDGVVLTSQAGVDVTAEVGSRQKPGEGVAGDVSDSGQPVLIEDPEDERLARRNQGVEEGAVFTLVAAPVLDRGSLVGVVEAVNRNDGSQFDEDELFLLTTMCETASNALHNASLLLAERKLEIMETLVTVSQEITSTLNLDRVLQTIVNAPQAVIPYERASIGLLQGGRFKLSAITGKTQVNAASPEVRQLDDILQWAALSGEVVDVRERDGEIDDPREETRAKFHKYFAESGMRGFYAKPLNDDTGSVGILCLESADPDFLTQTHLEIVQVLAGQATVALRNAQMYKDVPFISVLEPVMERKRKFMAMEKRRRKATYIAAIAIAVFLVVIPIPMRVDGDVIVAPAHRVQIQPEVEGVVQKVYVREGDHVARNTILAEVADWDYRAALSAAKAKYESAQLLMNRALATNDGTEAGIQKVQADYWRSEVARAQELLDKTKLRSPIDGVVATPHIENSVGRRLQFGDSFAEVVDASHAVVDIAVDDDQAGLLQAGSSAAIKLNFYPTHTFRGAVDIVSPKGEVQGESRVFFARVSLPNEDGAIRSGMQGRGKVTVGWRPSGYVLFRGMALWLYSKIWYWFGW
ncbi:MAG TPA: GAF domain-containing protein, partial [Terriglobales bacterium]|nr:GAF domain-containing protein [Terriglobales bacterium]